MPVGIEARRGASSSAPMPQIGVRAEGLLGVVGRRPIDAARVTTMPTTLPGQPHIIAEDGLIDVPRTVYGMHGTNGVRTEGGVLIASVSLGVYRPSIGMDTSPRTIPGVGTYILEPAGDLLVAQNAFDEVTHGKTTLDARQLPNNVVVYLPKGIPGGKPIRRAWQLVDPELAKRNTLAELSRNVPLLLRGGLRDIAAPPEIKAAALELARNPVTGKRREPARFVDAYKVARQQVGEERPDLDSRPLALLPDRDDPDAQFFATTRTKAEIMHAEQKAAQHQQLFTLTLLAQELQKHGYGDLPLANQYRMAQGIMKEVASGKADQMTVSSDPQEDQYASLFSLYARIVKEGQEKGPDLHPFTEAHVPDTEGVRYKGIAPALALVEVASDLTTQGQIERALVNEHYIADSVELALYFGERVSVPQILAARDAELARIQRERGIDSEVTADKNEAGKGTAQTIVTMDDLKKIATRATERSRRTVRHIAEAATRVTI